MTLLHWVTGYQHFKCPAGPRSAANH